MPGVERVTIARVTKTQGRRGEVAAEILTDFPERLRAVKELEAARRDGPAERLVVERSWFHKNKVVFKFAGYDSIEAAEHLVGRELQVARGETFPLPPSAYYAFDLIGCQVIARTGAAEGGRPLGRVRELMRPAEDSFAAPQLLVVDGARGEILIPFAAEICRAIDIERKVIEVELPEGLEDLNR